MLRGNAGADAFLFIEVAASPADSPDVIEDFVDAPPDADEAAEATEPSAPGEPADAD